MKLKKYVVVRDVLNTEDFKPEHAVDIRASDGMLKHLIFMRRGCQLIIPILVWKTTISAEIQMVKQQFGATQQMQIKDGNYVIQFQLINLLIKDKVVMVSHVLLKNNVQLIVFNWTDASLLIIHLPIKVHPKVNVFCI